MNTARRLGLLSPSTLSDTAADTEKLTAVCDRTHQTQHAHTRAGTSHTKNVEGQTHGHKQQACSQQAATTAPSVSTVGCSIRSSPQTACRTAQEFFVFRAKLSFAISSVTADSGWSGSNSCFTKPCTSEAGCINHAQEARVTHQNQHRDTRTDWKLSSSRPQLPVFLSTLHMQLPSDHYTVRGQK